jgi:hypothetical protein
MKVRGLALPLDLPLAKIHSSLSACKLTSSVSLFYLSKTK